jgi:lysophospholipase L1-like esterase
MANRNYPKNVTATTVIPFDNPITAIPQKTITGAVTFTKNTSGAQVGYGAMIEVVADGSHVPDLSAFYSVGTGTYDNTSGVVNLLTFFYTGSRFCVSVNPVSGTGGGGGDTTPPSTTSVSVENAEPNKVLIAYGETLDSGSVPATSAYTVKVNGSTRTISAVAITGANVKVTFGGAAVVSTDTITLDYVVPGSNPIQDVAGNDAASLTGVTVGNNVSGGVASPSVTGIHIENANKNLVLMDFDKAITTPLPKAGDFALSNTNFYITGELLPQNNVAVIGAGYDPLFTSASGTELSGSGEWYICNQGDKTRVWQNGNLTRIKFYATSVPTVGNVYFTIFRNNAILTQVEITSSLVVGQNDITLSTPIAVEMGDQTGFIMTGNTSGAYLGVEAVATSGSTANDGVIYNSSLSGFNSSPVHLLYNMVIQCYISKAPHLVIIGDSELASYPNNSPYIMGGYLKTSLSVWFELQRNLGIVLQDMSFSGQTTTQIAARFSADVVAKQPRYCVLGGGINDISSAVSPSTVISNYTSMLSAAQTAGIQVILTGLMPYDTDTSLYANIKSVNDQLKTLATTYGAWFCDIAPVMGDVNGVWFTWKVGYSSDGLHPVQAKYVQIGDLLSKCIANNTSILQNSSTQLAVRVASPFGHNDTTNLSFTAVTNPIKASDGGLLSSIASTAVTNNVPLQEEALVLNLVAGQTIAYKATKKLASGNDGYVKIKFTGPGGVKLGLSHLTTAYDPAGGYNGDTFYPYTDVGFYIAADGGEKVIQNGSPVSELSISSTTWYKIVRTGSVWKLQKSTDNVTYTDYYTYTGVSGFTGDMFIFTELIPSEIYGYNVS